MSAEVIIRKNGSDITDSVIFGRSRFQALANAVPGPFEMVCRDTDQILDFVTGDEITLDVDGVRLYGGYIMSIGRTHAFPADDTATVSSYENRLWQISGVDYNVLFDKRVIRNTADYLSNSFARFAGTIKDGTALTTLLDNYVDVPAGFDTSTYMNDVAFLGGDSTKPKSYMSQGTKLRDQWEKFAQWSAAVWYIDPDKNFRWTALEDSEARWGFSDNPDYTPITASPSEFQSAYYGYREVEAAEDGSVIVNDALIWGGSQWAGTGGTVFARSENTTSQTDHGRWQVGEVHFGEDGYGIQAGVDARADAIVNGPPGANALGQLKGLRYPQWSFRFAWHDQNVPEISGVRDHLRIGSLVYIKMETFGVDLILPLRSLSISFPELDDRDSPSSAYVRFDGEFSLNITDPFQLWKFLLARNTTAAKVIPLATVGDSDANAPYGALYQGVPTPSPNGSQTVFQIPFGYIATTTQVYINGLLQRRNTDYTETDPEAGEITFSSAPVGADLLFVTARTILS